MSLISIVFYVKYRTHAYNPACMITETKFYCLMFAWACRSKKPIGRYSLHGYVVNTIN